MHRTYPNFTEEAFLLSTFYEFVKCWKSSKRSRVFIESVNGEAFVNFSVFLGYPGEAHVHPNQQKRNPLHENKRKKSSKRIQRDNERAAKFQAKKRQEQAAASVASGDPPPTTSSPAETSVRAASVNFSFASPAPEDLITNDAMEVTSSPHLSPELLRQHQEDPPSLIVSHDEENVKENHSEPIQENITISEEVPEKTASEETESPGQDFIYVPDAEAVHRKFQNCSDFTRAVWAHNSRWYKAYIDADPSDLKTVVRRQLYAVATFEQYLLGCKKPKLFAGKTREEPCNSPLYEQDGCPCMGQSVNNTYK